MSGAMHICLICNGTGKERSGKPCRLCSLKWKTNRITKREEINKMLSFSKVVRGNYLDFSDVDCGWDLESNQLNANLIEVGQQLPLKQMLVNVQNQLISIAARNAEQRAEYHKIAGTLEKYRETKDIAKFITDSYQKLRRSWLLIEKTERMIAAKLEALD